MLRNERKAEGSLSASVFFLASRKQDDRKQRN